jgi:hypothetical protein
MQACIPNLGRPQLRRRLMLGALGLAAAAALAATLAAVGASVTVRAIIVVPFYMAALGFLQYREKT